MKEPLSRHHVWLNKGDFDRLAEIHPNYKPSVLIRSLVRVYLNSVDRANANLHVEPPSREAMEAAAEIIGADHA